MVCHGFQVGRVGGCFGTVVEGRQGQGHRQNWLLDGHRHYNGRRGGRGIHVGGGPRGVFGSRILVVGGRRRGKRNLLDVAWRGSRSRLHGREGGSQRSGKLGLFMRGVHRAIAALPFLRGGRGGVRGRCGGDGVSVGRGESVSPILSGVMRCGFGVRCGW